MRVAAVDLGTNSLRLLVSDRQPGTPGVDVLRRLEIVRLGEGVDATRRVTAPALERVGRVLEGYAADVERLGAVRVRAVGTSASRDAVNRDEIDAVVRRCLGVPLDVLTGDEEAALTYAGATECLPPGAPEPVLVVDVGGGSTELALGSGSGLLRAVSLDVGSVRLAERHLTGADGSPADPPAPAQVAAVVADVEDALDATAFPVASARSVLAVAGTATSVAAVAVAAPSPDDTAMDGVRLDRRRLDAVVEWLVTAPRAERAANPSVHPGRVDVLPSGALVLRTLVRRCRPGEVTVAVRDLLDGAAATLVEPAPGPAQRNGAA
jgi:exopolyphosphatase / guanosine-5'-triphosphate,3'-diphosphate pyrophosphatase